MGVIVVRVASAFLSVVCRPVVFFQDRVARPPSWWWAAVGPVLCTGLVLAGQTLFLASTAPAVGAALARAGVPLAFIASSQYLGLAAAASACVVTWLVASAVTIAWDVLFVGTDDVSRVFEVSGWAFYSQVPWLLFVVLVAWYYEPPFPDTGPVGVETVEPGRLLRLLRDDETLLVLRTVNEGSMLWLHALFGAGYHAISKMALSRCLLLALVIYGLPHVVGELL